MRSRMNQLILLSALCAGLSSCTDHSLEKQFSDPPREFSVLPFWFWNDTLKESEIVRQIADFEAHGVYGFVMHPRMGLPPDMEWLSPEMLRYMQIAIDEAVKRKMYVVLYDEGMYPSGSSSGQVVARNPEHAARGLYKIDLAPGETPKLEKGWKLVAVVDRGKGRSMAVVERPSEGRIRGIHWKNESTGEEEEPLAADILNPDAVDSFIELVYDKYAENFGRYFGNTILGIFTDEPSPLGRGNIPGMIPGNARLLPQINQILGYDFQPFFADLWYEEGEDWRQRRKDYERAISVCLEENYYRRLSEWCERHHIDLTGHPMQSMDLGAERYFQIPGQDLVWRYVTPGPSALEGEHSTMAKNASSAMVHLKRRRNSNELYGAYGRELTYQEMMWLANWCFVRGQNMLYPHAFYYSVRGPRYTERPPDVGPNAAWWPDFKTYADACRRMSWLNTDAKQICELAILGDANWLPDQAARECYQGQRDFNYLELRHLLVDARVDSSGVHLADMHYKAVILDGLTSLSEKLIPALEQLSNAGRLLIWKDSPFASRFPKAIKINTGEELLAAVDRLISPDLVLQPATKNIRYRHAIKNGAHYYILFNEESGPVTVKPKLSVTGKLKLIDPLTAVSTSVDEGEDLAFKPHELKILIVN
ncbi:MAG: hypothetical protein JNL51_10460 [Chitinophagaceae bacterium]|nr:hypothetical protein [Chitinophagaceae bacterium]